MQIVIEIDKRAWMDEKSIREVAFEYKHGCAFDRAIREGLRQAIVLPEGHGRLIDADETLRELGSYHIGGIDAIKKYNGENTWEDGLHTAWRVIDDAETIIEADKEVNAGEDSNI